MGRVVSLIALALAGLAACVAQAADESLGETRQAMFFDNSKRRDATPSEAEWVAKTDTLCAAFFLENTQTKIYLATARHCFPNGVNAWCTAGGKMTDNANVTGACKRVVAADLDRDVAVVEMTMAHAGTSALQLAAFKPAVNARLVMVGYPNDADPTTARRGKLTTTENCWVLSDVRPNPFANREAGALHDPTVAHNCSSYSGNGGGPMYLEGTRTVVGMPYTFQANDYTRRSATDLTTAADMGLVNEFVSTHAVELRDAGIVIAQNSDASEADVPDAAADEGNAGSPDAGPGTAPTRTVPRFDTPSAGFCSSAANRADGSGWMLLVAIVLLQLRAPAALGARAVRRSNPRRPPTRRA
jgi:hypothetical protein